MISERVDGIWNRVIVAGVTPQQFLFSHLIEGMVVVIIQLIENSVYFLVFLLPALSWNAKSLVLLILFLTGTAGVMFGLILSVICDSVGAYLYSSQVFLYPAMFICGLSCDSKKFECDLNVNFSRNHFSNSSDAEISAVHRI